jgi:hypothetical protein
MTPQAKAIWQTVAVLVAGTAVPVLMVVLADYLNIIVIAVTYSAVLVLFFREMYLTINAALLRPMVEDQQATAAFEGDPLKLHFYRGFRKYFDGDVSEQELQHWLERHRPQI